MDRFKELLAEEAAILLAEDEVETEVDAEVEESDEASLEVPPSSEAHQPWRASPV